jgi:hypothetical protein
MRVTFIAVALIAVSASACASREARVRNALLKTGLPPPVADCMAGRMVDRLSLGQLRRLQSLSGLREDRIATLTVGEFVELARTLGDPELLAVVSTAGLGCAIAS